jgi:type IV fimbrial biogenesis protein FimT
MGQMIANTKIKGAANELFFDLSYARSEAIKRNEKVRVRRDASWTDGWKVVLVKPDDTDGVTLKTQSATKAISASEWIDGVAGTIDKIDFNSAGRTAAPAGSLRLDFSSSASLTTMRCVSLTASGRPAVRIDKNRDGDCND